MSGERLNKFKIKIVETRTMSINTVIFIANIDQIQHFFLKLLILTFTASFSYFLLVAPRLSDQKFSLVIHKILRI